MFYDDRRMAGLIIFVGVFQFTIGLMAAAAVDPPYSVHDNYISDLGVRAGASIFNVSIIYLGISLAYAAYYVDRALRARWFSLLLLVPDAGGRGRGVLSGKVFEYLAAGRPILAVVPPDGAAAELIRETRAGMVVAPDDVDGIRVALEVLRARFLDGGLPGVELSERVRDRLSRRARVEEMATLLREIT